MVEWWRWEAAAMAAEMVDGGDSRGGNSDGNSNGGCDVSGHDGDAMAMDYGLCESLSTTRSAGSSEILWVAP